MRSNFKTTIHAGNPVHLWIESNNPVVHSVLRKKFCFEVPNAKFSPAFRKGTWDGIIRLYQDGRIYSGLLNDVVKTLKVGDYGEVKIRGMIKRVDHTEAFDQWIATKTFPFEPDDFQLDAAKVVLNKGRRLILSPTSSGKSFIIYLVLAYLIENDLLEGNFLLVVPSIMLFNQLYKDLLEYGFPEDCIQQLRTDKTVTHPVAITTWQGIVDQEPEWFEQFEGVIVDEAHNAKAKSLTGIMENLCNTMYRMGVTATIHDGNVNELVLRGLFGGITETTTIKELMARGRIAKLTVNMVRLDYSEVRKKNPDWFMSNLEWSNEDSFLSSLICRDKAILLPIKKNKGKNGIVLFRNVEHCERMYERYTQAFPDAVAYIIHGKVSEKRRSQIQAEIDAATEEGDRGVVLFATYGTLSTGVSIKNLDYGVFGSPMKSKVTVLQSVGRLLRVSKTKTEATLYDLWDDFRFGKEKNSYGKKHAEVRLSKYLENDIKVKELALTL